MESEVDGGGPACQFQSADAPNVERDSAAPGASCRCHRIVIGRKYAIRLFSAARS